MNPPDPRIEAIFHEALARAPAEREAFVAEACAGDEALQHEIQRLLAAHEEAGTYFEPPNSPAIEVELARLKPKEMGETVGPYKLREQVGEGGFGTVWVADQERPVRRRVALKIIKLGMDTKEVIARFEQERQALAMMDHPNIAKVLDAGATQWGRPYFVMELVRGIKITDYCDQQNLPTADRLSLFVQVCQAVQHAHQKGIIHRDLKPSNILVTLHDGVPVPKVIDFGVAKATQQQQRLSDLTIYTQFQQMIGTPLYMSPEQAEMSGLDIDTRTDIYALGVLLYELLIGRTPFDPEVLMKAGLDEIRRVIREEEPPKPSTALQTMAADARASVAQHRRSEGAKMARLLSGELDWIVMKALEKDRARRYETANGFAEDIRRYLANEPVTAAAPSAAYLFRKFARRHQAALGLIIFAILCAAAPWLSLRFLDSRRPTSVEINTEPPGAEVWRDGQRLGVTPFAEMQRTRGPVAYVLKAVGFDDSICIGNLLPNRLLSMQVSLRPQNRAVPPPQVNPATGQIFWGEIMEVENIVQISPDGKTWRAAGVGIQISKGDWIRTGEHSRATIKSSDRAFIRIDELTILSPKKDGIEIHDGKIHFFERKGMKIITPSVSGEIRG